MKLFAWFMSTALAAVLGGAAHAATVSVTPNNLGVLQGGQATFELVADFGSLSVLGGAVDLTWDPAVITFDSFTFDPAMSARDPSFDIVENSSPSSLSVGLGNFSGLSFGPGTVLGSMSFNVVGGLGSATQLTLADSQRFAGFFDTAGDPILVDYSDATLTVTAVPLPAAGWLLLGALGLLAAPMRRARTTQAITHME